MKSKREKRQSGEEERGEQKRTLCSVMCCDVAEALGQMLPVFCVHLRLVFPVLL